MLPFIQHRSGTGDEESRVKQATSQWRKQSFFSTPLYPGNSSVLPPVQLLTRGLCLSSSPQRVDVKALTSEKSAAWTASGVLPLLLPFYLIFFPRKATAVAVFAVRACLTLCPRSKHSGKPHSEVDGFSPPTITVNRYLSDCYQQLPTCGAMRWRFLFTQFGVVTIV